MKRGSLLGNEEPHLGGDSPIFEIIYSNLEQRSIFSKKSTHFYVGIHTIYIRNNMGQKCEGNCGLWVLNKILKKTYPEILSKIVGAVWEIPAK